MGLYPTDYVAAGAVALAVAILIGCLYVGSLLNLSI